jgi:hypothetical protein
VSPRGSLDAAHKIEALSPAGNCTPLPQTSSTLSSHYVDWIVQPCAKIFTVSVWPAFPLQTVDTNCGCLNDTHLGTAGSSESMVSHYQILVSLSRRPQSNFHYLNNLKFWLIPSSCLLRSPDSPFYSTAPIWLTDLLWDAYIATDIGASVLSFCLSWQWLLRVIHSGMVCHVVC